MKHNSSMFRNVHFTILFIKDKSKEVAFGTMLVITQDPNEETCPRTIQYHVEKTG